SPSPEQGLPWPEAELTAAPGPAAWLHIAPRRSFVQTQIKGWNLPCAGASVSLRCQQSPACGAQSMLLGLLGEEEPFSWGP
ncbi:hypothetical protein KIL84_016991, partial [Mauremys mutica]